MNGNQCRPWSDAEFISKQIQQTTIWHFQLTFPHKKGFVILCKFIATDKALFHPKNADIFLISPLKHMLWVLIISTSPRRFGEALLMSTHNICFCGEIRKILKNIMWIPPLICSYEITIILSRQAWANCVDPDHSLWQGSAMFATHSRQFNIHYEEVKGTSLNFRTSIHRSGIGLNRSGYQVSCSFISWRKHLLWVLIRGPSMSTHNICVRWEIRKI